MCGVAGVFGQSEAASWTCEALFAQQHRGQDSCGLCASDGERLHLFKGMGLVKEAGGMTIAQSEQSCVVYGMPKAAIERGYAVRVVALDALANTLQAQCMQERKTGNKAESGDGGKAAGAGKN